MKVLLIRFSSAGDILLLNNTIKFLKKQAKEIRIYLLTKEIYTDIAEILNVNYITFKKNKGFFNKFKEMMKLIDNLNNEKFDVVFDFQNTLRSRFILSFLNAKRKFILNKNIIKRRLMVLFKWFLNYAETVSERYIKLVASAFKYDMDKLKINKDSKKNRKIKTIVIHTGAKWKLKRWPYYLELIELFKKTKDIKIIITGLKEEVEKNSGLLYIKGRNIVNKIGQTDLKDLFRIIKKSDFFIGNDTLIAHMAAINNVPGIIIMGPTVKSFGFISEKDFFVIEKELACRPCHLHGGNCCPIKTFNCMTDIKAEYVHNEFKKLIKK